MAASGIDSSRLRVRIGELLRPLALDVPLGRLYDAAPSLRELSRPCDYRRAVGLWRHLRAGGYTLIGSRRARALQHAARVCERERVPGDLVDCGCFNGGSSVMMSTGAPSRDVWAFDSFEGLPQAGERDPDRARGWTGQLVASEAKLREAFERFARPERLRVVKGWFEDTLPRTSPRIDRVAILHADGDWYESVRLTLESFEPKVSPGGFVVIDDYGAWEGARDATDEYRAERGIDAKLVEIDHTSAYWRKQSEPPQPQAVGSADCARIGFRERPFQRKQPARPAAQRPFQRKQPTHEPLYREDLGWRSSTVAGALRLRPAIAQVTAAEGRLLERYAAGARSILEIGIAEGGSAWHLRRALDPAGTITLIDTYPTVLGMNMSRAIASRLVESVDRGRAEWLRMRSDEAARGWSRPIDFLFIDGDHAYESVRRDFEHWSPHLTPTGVLAFHDALTDAPWMDESFGSAAFVRELSGGADWRLVDGVDSLAVFRRAAPA